jgi:hypothetical protein
MRYSHNVSFAPLIKALKKNSSHLLSKAAKLSRVQPHHRNSIIQSDGRRVLLNNLTSSISPTPFSVPLTLLHKATQCRKTASNYAPVANGVVVAADLCAFLTKMTRVSLTRLSVGHFRMTMTNFLDDYFQAAHCHCPHSHDNAPRKRPRQLKQLTG